MSANLNDPYAFYGRPDRMNDAALISDVLARVPRWCADCGTAPAHWTVVRGTTTVQITCNTCGATYSGSRSNGEWVVT